jgi:PAS domain S-box-containing protein
MEDADAISAPDRAPARGRARGAVAPAALEHRPDRRPLPPGVDELLRRACEEAGRLLGADGAFMYLYDAASDRLRFRYHAGIADLPADHFMRRLVLPPGIGLFGRAVATRRVVVTGDYLSDTTFEHNSASDAFAIEVGLRSLVAAPMIAGDEVFGALGTYSAEEDAFTAPQVGLVRALAGHAALAMANARLIEELDHSREALERTALVERSLRELGTRISGATDPEAVVQYTIDEARRLLHGAGARIDLVDPELNLLRGAYSSGEEEILEVEWPRDPGDRLEVGASGRAVVTGRTCISPDYLTDTNLVHGLGPDTYARNKGIRGVIASPLLGEQGPFGAITVWSTEADAFHQADASLLETIAGQAAVALGRARLIEELGRSRKALARRAEEEQALREIAGRLGRLGEDPHAVLLRIVHEAARLLGAERARLDLVEAVSGARRWTSPADAPFTDGIEVDTPPDRAPVGLAGLAVREGRAVATPDYLADTRFAHYEEGDASVREVGLHAVVAAPVVGEDGLLGVLQAGHRAIDAFGHDAVRLIEALAGQVSIAVGNARLSERLAASQERYRFLVENSPDIIYATDADGRITYFSESAERTLGREPADVVGRHFREIVRTTDGVPAGRRFAEMAAGGDAFTSRMELVAASGEAIPFEVTASAMRVDDVFAGIHGAARDVRDRERLERELRDSEERYRYLVQSSPDLVWMTDAHGRFTFVSDQATRILGWTPEELVGRRFDELAPPSAVGSTIARFRWLQRRPTETHRTRFRVLTRDGRERSMEVTAIGMVADGRFEGAHGAARDVSDRERLETDLRRQAAEIAASEERAHLARELHDSVTQAMFSMTLLSRSIEILLERDPAQVPERLADLRELQRDALAEMRALIFELRPGNIEEHGLVQALRTHSASLSGRIGLPVVLEADPDVALDRPPIEVEEALYRIAQEALHNVVKHAGAHEVRLGVNRVPEGVRMTVADDGRGFDPSAVPDGHLGLAGMRARAERLGGQLRVMTGPGEGTLIDVIVPEVGPAAADGDEVRDA